ncbi:hypothetical protein PHLGIDRAFT_88607 [Phlebiopsis gigantea 11061_1 CR5-6]|uniref:CS domain-containing protein n=1 Tax=Phlebiopsis gigantea (strain 11061_1 CR5-6) TaxID=745531 RepID=A0A0C3S9B9_PHLG1|nr:hypothetical protein PHLGIDRAFT_88607 [Phlebiopsis gigantea 11061_1 CR5-6]
MVRCTNKGCGQEYVSENNLDASCVYHSGAPVFHEGLKSWSCCQDVNRPVLDFDDFMKIPVCTRLDIGQHTSVVPKPEPAKPQSMSTPTNIESEPAQETPAPPPVAAPVPASTPAPPPPPEEDEEDDLTVEVPVGTTCRHKGCGKTFVSNETSRLGDGQETVCIYHPKTPIFHEGSKGYLCCKRRVLEFEEFLKIEGCKTGRHLFVPKTKSNATEQTVDCRIDHYQTPTEVHVSVFAKQADKERSTVIISASEISFDLLLPGSKRFRRSIELFGPIDPNASSYKYYGTKVELLLKKQDTRSWAVLEKNDRAAPLNLTFGVGGRTGTIGAKELILDNQNATRARP